MARDKPQTDVTRTVQTEISTPLYHRFHEAADEQELTIREAAAQAIADFTYEHRPIEPGEPLFAPLSWDEDEAVCDDDASDRID